MVSNDKLPLAIIIDIDGTIADKGARSPYDWGKVSEDTPIKPVISLLANLNIYPYPHVERKITPIFVSGRDEVCYRDTSEWINKYLPVEYRVWTPKYDEYAFELSPLFMRPLNDCRPDTEIKQEIYENYIKDKYDVLFVIDDRPKVIKMWRSLGLFVFDVNQTGEDF